MRNTEMIVSVRTLDFRFSIFDGQRFKNPKSKIQNSYRVEQAE